jgi:hypothetical protein
MLKIARWDDDDDDDDAVAHDIFRMPKPSYTKPN